MDTFTVSDIGKRMGIPRNRLNHWLVLGHVQASIEPSTGRGVRNLFSRWDLYRIELYRTLLEEGFSRELAGVYVKAFREDVEQHGPLVWAHFYRAEPGKDPWAYMGARSELVFHADGTASVPDLTPQPLRAPWASILTVNLKRLRDRVDAQIG